MRRDTRLGWVGLTVILVVTGITILAPADADAAPAGFSVETVPFSGLIEPTAIEFANTGQVFVAERRGVVKVFDNLDDSTSRNTADLRLRVFNGGDRGLLDMALDPQYPTRPYLWALYTKNAELGGQAPKYGSGLSDTDACPDGGANDCRVSAELTRLTLDPTNGTWTGEESVVLTGWCQQFGSHSIGSVVFGPDGFMYISAGDAASYNAVDTGTLGTQRCDDPASQGGALRAQSARRPAGNPAVLNGAVLRVDPDTGAPAPGNPFIADPDPNRQRILAYGFRNPFRISPKPSTNEIWVADVGWNDWEEINKITIDANPKNFGWPCYEGPARQSGYDGADTPLCESLYAAGSDAVVNPVYTYNHGSTVGSSCAAGSSSISDLAFTSNSISYPAAYQGGLFFGDYARGCIWFAQMQGSTILTDSIVTFDSASYATELANGPNGDIYIVDIVAEQIKRIRYSAGGNTPPIANARANPTAGAVPLTVNFDGSGSSDPDAGSSVSYAWDLDADGAFDDSAAISPTWTYTSPGTVVAKLRVTDNLGASNEASVTIYAGNTAPVVSLTSSATSAPWKVGDVISFTASAVDAEDGALPAERVTTKLIIKHCPGGVNCHSHVQQTFQGSSGSFVAPDHEYPSWLDLELTATDSAGSTSTANIRLDPATVNLNVDTVPSGLSAVVGAVSRTTPFNVTVIQGSTNSISVASPQVTNATYAFRSWSDGGSRAHDVVAAQSANYVATFDMTGPPPSIPGLVGSWSFNEGSGTVAADGSGRGNAGALVNGAAWTSAGKYGGAITFDGVNDYVNVPDSNSLDVTSGVTLAAWVRPTTLSAWRQVMLKERPGDLVYGLYATGESGNLPEGQVVVNSNWQFVQAPAALAVNTWSHVAMTYDGAAMRMYVNGALVATKAQTGAVLTSTGALRIGGNSIWGEWFAGQIDEARVYNRALSATEVVTDSTTGGSPDTQAPSIPTGLSASATVNSVNLSWAASTDNSSTVTYELHRSQVNGFSPVSATRIASGVSSLSYSDSPLVGGTYYYRILATDGTNFSSPSEQVSAVVTGDAQAPSVPTGLAAVVAGSTVNVSWSASTDNVGVVSYQVQRVASGGATTTFLVNSPATTLADVVGAGGTYSYSVRANDQAGNWSAFSSSVSATVLSDSAPPSVTLTAPAAGSTVSGSVLLRANATDDVGVAGVQFSVDGAAVGSEDTSSPYEFSWSSTSVANGAHQITALARDASGKSTTSAAVSVSVANTGPSGLVGSWSFNEGSGTVAADGSGRGNAGALVNGAAWTSAGKYGGAITFDGVNDYVNVPDSNSLDVTSGVTLAAWVRPTTLSAWRQVMLKERPGDLVYGLYATGESGNLPEGQVVVNSNWQFVQAPAALAVNTWSHVAMTYDGAAMRMYVNGALVATKAQTGAVLTSTGALRIGGNSIWGEWFAGQIDEARVYNRALSATEVVTDSTTGAVPDAQAPSVPTGLAAVVAGSTVNVSWSASTDNVGVVSYQVQRVASGGATTTFLVNSPATTLADVVGAGGTYSYSVRANDQAGNWSAFSSSVSATVLSDSAPPSVTLTAPAAGSTVSGSVLLRANATDDVGVAGVQFSVDGAAVGSEDTSSPYEFSWSSTSVANGAHQITALARDASGKSTTSAAVSVSVANTGPSGLVGSWSFNEGSGTVAADGSGRGNAGALVNGAAWTSAGKYGGAITFDGVNDYVNVPDSNSLDVTSGVTLAAWVRPTTLSAWRQVMLKERPGDLVYGLYATGESGNLPEGQVVVNSNWQFVQAPAALAVNTWSHVAMTYDGAAMRMYVNGALVATKAQTGAVLTSTGALRIGGNSIWGEWFAGQIDEARVYNRALSATEILAIRDTAS